MKSNRLIIYFLLKFLGVYALLFIIYSTYLGKAQVADAFYSCEPITVTVAEQSRFLINIFGYETVLQQSEHEFSMQLIVEGKFVARVIEGCTSISIIILFISFIVAFSGKLKVTLYYIFFGSLIIYSFNILRIALITICLYEFPQHQELLHNIVFPLLIYGVTFLLWILWVLKFSKIE